MRQCNHCEFWDYELAENQGKDFSEAKGLCSRQWETEFVTTGQSRCGEFRAFKPDSNAIAQDNQNLISGGCE